MSGDPPSLDTLVDETMVTVDLLRTQVDALRPFMTGLRRPAVSLDVYQGRSTEPLRMRWVDEADDTSDLEWRTEDGHIYATQPLRPILDMARRARDLGCTNFGMVTPSPSGLDSLSWKIIGDSLLLVDGGSVEAPPPLPRTIDELWYRLRDFDKLPLLKRHRDDVALHDERMAKRPKSMETKL